MEYTRYCPSTIDTETHPHLMGVLACWQTKDGKYDILYDKPGEYRHLRIKRIDNQPIRNWMDMQEIKNDLFGKEVVAVEIFPADSKLRNGSSTYHLWMWDAMYMPDLNELYNYKKE